MANHVVNTVVDDLVGYGNGLFRVARVVVDHAFELSAVHPAGLVDLLDRHLGANELHLAVLGNRTGHRAGQGDLDGIGRYGVAGDTGESHGGEQFGNLLGSLIHSAPLLCFSLLLSCLPKLRDRELHPAKTLRQLYRNSVDCRFTA
ncbi:hypothetical protein D3C72_1815970 [compost metagenome]